MPCCRIREKLESFGCIRIILLCSFIEIECRLKRHGRVIFPMPEINRTVVKFVPLFRQIEKSERIEQGFPLFVSNWQFKASPFELRYLCFYKFHVTWSTHHDRCDVNPRI